MSSPPISKCLKVIWSLALIIIVTAGASGDLEPWKRSESGARRIYIILTRPDILNLSEHFSIRFARDLAFTDISSWYLGTLPPHATTTPSNSLRSCPAIVLPTNDSKNFFGTCEKCEAKTSVYRQLFQLLQMDSS